MMAGISFTWYIFTIIFFIIGKNILKKTFNNKHTYELTNYQVLVLWRKRSLKDFLNSVKRKEDIKVLEGIRKY